MRRYNLFGNKNTFLGEEESLMAPDLCEKSINFLFTSRRLSCHSFYSLLICFCHKIIKYIIPLKDI